MLDLAAADTPGVVHRFLVIVALACCALVFASFAMFARDQVAGASKHQQNELAAEAPGGATTVAPTPPPKQKGPAQPRRFIDGASRALTAPFRSLVSSNSQWVDHLVPAMLALLVYGVGLGYLARFSRGLT